MEQRQSIRTQKTNDRSISIVSSIVGRHVSFPSFICITISQLHVLLVVDPMIQKIPCHSIPRRAARRIQQSHDLCVPWMEFAPNGHNQDVTFVGVAASSYSPKQGRGNPRGEARWRASNSAMAPSMRSSRTSAAKLGLAEALTMRGPHM